MADFKSIYKEPIDFGVLGLQSPAFNKFLKYNGQLDFSDPKAVMQLTKSLLERDFVLDIDLPEDRLCPPVPNRLNYILWIQSLLDSTSDKFSDVYDPERDVIGLDIGTGSSCIYPLLGCVQRPNWRFVATDIDEKNIQYARQNIRHNSLHPRIRTLFTKPADALIPLENFGLHSIDFTICNPPFYPSPASLLASASLKNRPPYSACTGAEIEMVTPGGEIAFVARMIRESVVLGERCQWYTSMLGKLKSVEFVIEELKAVGCVNWAVTEFVQGGKTRRWGVGWSWGDRRPTQHFSRNISSLAKSFLPFPTDFSFSLSTTLPSTISRLNTILKSLPLRWKFRPQSSTGLGFCRQNVWSRAARRQRERRSAAASAHEQDQRSDEDDDEREESEEDEKTALGFKVLVREAVQGKDEGEGDEESGVEILVRWVLGRESVLFESFCGMLKREMGEHSLL